jgi:hypothetical protein
MGKLRTVNSRFAIIFTASLMKKLKSHTNRELIQRTYGIPITYLASRSQGYLSNCLCSAFVHACFNRAGPKRRKPKSNKKKGITTAKVTTNITLNQVAVALKLIKEYTKMTR